MEAIGNTGSEMESMPLEEAFVLGRATKDEGELCLENASNEPKNEGFSAVRDFGKADFSADALSCFLRSVPTYKPMTREAESELFGRIAAGNKAAVDEAIGGNLWLVVRMARKFSYYRVPLLDLISEGNLVLLKAVRRFDPGRGFRFATYLTKCLKRRLADYVVECRMSHVTIPPTLRKLLGKLHYVVASYHQVHGHYPTIVEMAEKIGISVVRAEKLVLIASINVATISSAAEVKMQHESGQSRNVLSEEQLASKEESLLDKKLEQEQTDFLETGIRNLSEIQRTIIQLRFGMDDSEMEHPFSAIIEKGKVPERKLKKEYDGAIRSLRDHFYNSDFRDELTSEAVESLVEPMMPRLFQMSALLAFPHIEKKRGHVRNYA